MYSMCEQRQREVQKQNKKSEEEWKKAKEKKKHETSSKQQFAMNDITNLNFIIPPLS